ncbi:ABC transporter substrate-binding protein [Melaminivora jejuensis]|uniref:ABC transporter substrate-binding protein n=1 Tax=Melaminivora jejuensis TaxID=1267217 RepID=UPI001ADEFE15|nr:ABC transporter substrate-binding protein [Melaminivora jejuensis]UHJ65105.1 ABC transporter substrate-binding protein [Melaminivora jejuensis]
MHALSRLSRRQLNALALASATLMAGPALAQEVVKIGYSGPLSGGAAQYGKNVLDGMQMAVAEINAASPEVAGKKVKFEIVALDDKYNPSETAINAQRLVQQHKTAAILVPHSGGIFALQTTNERSNFIVLAYSSVPQITAKGNKLTLRIPPEYTGYIEPFSKYEIERFGKKVAMVGADHDYAKAWAAAFKPGWEKLGGSVVAENPMSYNRATDFYSGVSKALADKPDVMFIGGASEPTALVVKQARELGFKGGFIIMDQAKLDEMARVLGGYAMLEGAMGVMPVIEDARPEMKAFVERFGKIYPGRTPGSEAQWNYTTIHATIKAMQLAGTTSDAAAIQAKLDAAFKSLTPAANPGEIKGVDERGGTITQVRGAAVKDGKILAIETAQ